MQELLSLTLAGLAAAYLVRRSWSIATGGGSTACAKCRACAAQADPNAGHERALVPISELQASVKK
jgi:hypothetical protein